MIVVTVDQADWLGVVVKWTDYTAITNWAFSVEANLRVVVVHWIVVGTEAVHQAMEVGLKDQRQGLVYTSLSSNPVIVVDRVNKDSLKRHCSTRKVVREESNDSLLLSVIPDSNDGYK